MTRTPKFKNILDLGILDSLSAYGSNPLYAFKSNNSDNEIVLGSISKIFIYFFFYDYFKINRMKIADIISIQNEQISNCYVFELFANELGMPRDISNNDTKLDRTSFLDLLQNTSVDSFNKNKYSNVAYGNFVFRQ